MPEIKEQQEVQETPAAPESGRAPSNLMGLLSKIGIYAAIAIVAIFGAFMITTKVLKPMMAHGPTSAVEAKKTEKPTKEEPKPEPKEEKSESKEAAGGGEGHGAKNAKFYNIESIVVNPAGTGGTRFLSCGVSFELSTPEDTKTFEGLGVQIKDILITILSSKTVDELSDVQDRNKMRRQILFAVNHLTDPATAKAVYLTDFVLQ